MCWLNYSIQSGLITSARTKHPPATYITHDNYAPTRVPWSIAVHKARFPPGEFIRATRSEIRNPVMRLVCDPKSGYEIGLRKNSPRKSSIASNFLSVRANKFAGWKTGFTRRDFAVRLTFMVSVVVISQAKAVRFSYYR